uniref:Endoplasmic reticulum resident protein 29 C-terminal domain-containing protein n=1 Tax=Chrysotila carterae TaxID=13221 RepID=A0A7S4BBT4_CHRCT
MISAFERGMTHSLLFIDPRELDAVSHDVSPRREQTAMRLAISAALLSACTLPVVAYIDRGILKLDNTTFDRIIDGSRNVFVRFDKEYAYGEAHDAWKEYAKTVGESAADLLSADVGVSEYGEKENSDLIERYGIKTADFPQYRLFVKGTSGLGSPIAYTGAAKTDEFVRFVQEKAGAWIGLPGQIKELDEIAKEFMGSTEQAALLQKAEAAAASSTQDTAKYYVKVMTKATGDKDFVAKETTRLKKMMEESSVKPAKKEQFGRRLNVLSSF